jgi:multiple sugar transport system permease protein
MTTQPVKHLLIAPPLIFFALLSVVPIVFTVRLSLMDVSIGGGGSWVGVDNYIQAFNDTSFRRSYLNTVLYVVVGVTIQYVLGLGLALLVNGLTRGQRIVRLIILLPLMLAPLIIGFVWQTLFDTRYGPLNVWSRALGVGTIEWLTEPVLAFVSIILVDTWQWTPFMFLILFAGLRSLPTEPFEAARVDGASGWRVFWDMTFPMLIPASLAAILLKAIQTFKLFDIVFFMTGGGPGSATSTVTLSAYTTALQSGNIGYGAAMTVVLLLTVIVVSAVLLIGVGLAMSRANASGKAALKRLSEKPVSGGVAE